METTKVTRKIGIDYGHTLPNHFSFCSQIHGHRGTIEMTVEGPIQDEGSSEGMVMDFHFLKEALMEEVHDVLDHEFAVWEEDTGTLEYIKERNNDPVILEDPPTAENLAKWAYNRIQDSDHIPEDCELVRIRWQETPNNWADYEGDE